MTKRCAICGEDILEEYGKLEGTMLKIIEDKKIRWIYVCKQCQKNKEYIERAKIKSA